MLSQVTVYAACCVLAFVSDATAQVSACSRSWQLIRDSYVDSLQIDTTRSVEDVLNHLDPFSCFMSESEYNDFTQRFSEKETIYGLVTSAIDGYVTIEQVSYGSDLQDSGVLPGDQILALGGESLNGNDALADTMLSRYDGLTFLIRRPKTGKVLTVRAYRKSLPTPSIGAAVMLSDGIGFISIGGEHDNTCKALERAVDSLQGLGMKALVLDMRWNPGGYLEESLDMVNLFTGRTGEILLTTKGRMRGTNVQDTARRDAKYPNLPLAVLISGGTCSAAEIFAGILQDKGRAVLIGEPTLGKCQVMRLFPLACGGWAYLNVSRYFLPSGRSIGRPYTGNRLNGDYYRVYPTAWNLDHSLDSSISEGSSCDAFETAQGVNLCGNSGIIPDIFEESNYYGDHPIWWRTALWQAAMPFIQDTIRALLYAQADSFITRFHPSVGMIERALQNAAKADTSEARRISMRLAADAPVVLKALVGYAVWQERGFAQAWEEYDPQVRIARSLLIPKPPKPELEYREHLRKTWAENTIKNALGQGCCHLR